MEQPQREIFTLEDIIINEELSRRNPRHANLLKENEALRALARQLVDKPQTMLQSLVDIALEMCNAGSAGVSLLEISPSGEEVFLWNALAGKLAHYVGRTSPRNFSPCGVCIDQGAPQLYSYPERYFTYIQEVNTPVIELLVLPFVADNHTLGTIWIVSHTKQRHFDSEDLRVMMNLADFTAAAVLLNQRQTQELMAKNVQLEALVVKCRRSEELARESEEQFRLFLTASSDTVYKMSADWSEMRYLKGKDFLPSTENPSSTWLETYIPQQDQPRVLGVIQEAIRTKSMFQLEHCVVRLDGTLGWVLSRAIPLLNADNEIIEWIGSANNITNRKQIETEIAADLKNTQLLRDLSTRLIVEGDIQVLYDEIVKAAIALMRADGGTLQILDEATQNLLLLSTQGFDQAMRNHFYCVNANSKSVCGMALLTGKQTFVNFNVPDTEDPHGSLQMHLDAGYLCAQSTPLIARSGKKIGMFSTHWREHYQPSDREWHFLDLLARQAADFIEQRQAKAALRESEERLRLAADVAGFGTYDYNPYSAQSNWSQNLKEMHGLPKDAEITFERISQLIHPDDQEETLNRMCQFLEPGGLGAFEHEFRIIRTDGAVRWLLDKGQVFFKGESDQRIADRVVGIVLDITNLKQAEQDRLQLIREQAAREEERQRAVQEAERSAGLAELDQAKTIFFSNISHEFRTPLTLLLATLQDVLSDTLAPPQRERLETAYRNAMRLLKLVNTLLDFSRIEAKRIKAVYEATDLPLLTTELASIFRSAIEQAGLQLVIDCPPMQSPVYVDREMWEKIVLNLLSNAFKFTFEGEIVVRMNLADEHHVMLQVQDTGTGISPEELPHLFERFYQIRGAKARTHEGSGIGLALVQELIKMHGGTIDVSSTFGQGSCFTVTIPLGTAHLPSVSVATLGASGGRDSAQGLLNKEAQSIQMRNSLTSTAFRASPYVQEAEGWLKQEDLGKLERSDVGEQGDQQTILPDFCASPSSAHILVVDDNGDLRDYLTRILSEHVEVKAVADGASALVAVQKRVPDLILSDVMMPGLDGFELLKALRANPFTKEIPIILLSARASVESVIEGLIAGADDYLIKPFSAQELITRVKGHLRMADIRLEALHKARISISQRDELLSMVSHELNTPLVAILGWTRLLRANPPSPFLLAKSLETIERNATLQAKLIQDLLDISRITAGKLCLNPQPVELGSLIETAIATVNESARTKNIELTYQFQPRSIIIQGDSDRLQQIVLNLLTNAIKFTPLGGRIQVCLDVVKTQAQIVVSDTGCGIDAEFLPYVFDSFRQAKSSHSTKGLGLGLAIARYLVELHGGTICAESPGASQGATFTVKLPLFTELESLNEEIEFRSPL